MKLRTQLLTVLLLALACGTAAGQQRRYIDQETTPYFGGDAGNLPVGAGADLAMAIDHARNRMPAVRWALEVCSQRGYVRHAERDSGFVQSNPPLTLVILALEKLDLVNPPGKVGAPVIQIATTLDNMGVASTQVSGGVVFLDTRDGSMTLADDLPGYEPDGSFDAQPSGGGSGGKGFHGEVIVKCLRDYFVCAGVGNSACVLQALLPPNAWSVPRGLVCVAFNTFRCVYQFGRCWSD